jgi:hypothetical protein
MNATSSLLSSGYLACNLQRPVTAVLKAARELAMEPALLLNGVPHYDAVQAEAIADHLTKIQTTTN